MTIILIIINNDNNSNNNNNNNIYIYNMIYYSLKCIQKGLQTNTMGLENHLAI